LTNSRCPTRTVIGAEDLFMKWLLEDPLATDQAEFHDFSLRLDQVIAMSLVL